MIGIYNVREPPYNADNTGAGDAHPPIARATIDAMNAGGGIVLIPPGTYKISKSLALVDKVYFRGMGGSTFGSGPTIIDPGPISPALSTVIQADAELNADMIINGVYGPEPDLTPIRTADFSQTGIENIALDGTDQSSGNGISIITSNESRSQATFRNILIYKVNGIGFLGGDKAHELYFDHVYAYGCSGNGVELEGQDIHAYKLGAGVCGAVGLRLSIGSSGRYYDIDSWSNDIGVEITNTAQISFFRLQCDVNKKYGLYIHQNSGSLYPPAQIQVYRGTFRLNSQSLENGYSDILISSSEPLAQGPIGVLLHGCQFNGNDEDGDFNKPKHAIENSGNLPKRVLVSDSFFRKAGYGSSIFNDTAIISVRDCFEYAGGAIFGRHDVAYGYHESHYTIMPSDTYVTINTLGSNTIATLPRLSDTQLGTMFYVSKVDTSPATVTIQGSGGESIDAATNSLSRRFETLMIVNAGTSWYAVKLGP